MSFGFSAGDLIAALELVATVIDALRESGCASSEYREIIRQLYSLETALISVKRLEVDPAQNAELISLRQAAAQCQRTIDDFWKKTQKYQHHLRAGGSTSRLKDGWMKMQWTKCKKEDMARFKADLAGHTESIQLLLMAMQMTSSSLHDKRHDKQAKSLASNVQDSYFGCMQRLSNIAESLQSGIEQGKKLLVMTTQVMLVSLELAETHDYELTCHRQTNIKVFQVVLDIQRIITTIPGQIDRQQPIYFIDALGRSSSFHLEFVRSPEALVSILKVNFRNVGHASDMIERGEFVIQDSVTKKDVNLGMEWDLCFSPGQRVEMSMVFKRPTRPTNNCPTCRADCGKYTDEDIECLKCGLNFRRILDLEDVPDNTSNVNLTNKAPSYVKFRDMLGTSLPMDYLKRKRGGNQEEIDEVSLFRRVRIYNNIHPSTSYKLRSDLNYRAKVFELRNTSWFDHGTGFVDIMVEYKDGRWIPTLFVECEIILGRELLQMQITGQKSMWKQLDTLIIWTDDRGIEMSLSFQDGSGCMEIWKHINDFMQRML